MRAARLGLAALLAALALLAAPAAWAASPAHLTPTEVGLDGDGESWRPVRAFQLAWNRLSDTPTPSRIELRIRDALGVATAPTETVAWEHDLLRGFSVPPRPGVYTVEFRLADAESAGPWTSATVRFDDTQPGPALPVLAGEWIGAGARAKLQVAPPPAPLPPSGVRGYAVTVDQRPDGHPCRAAPRCAPDELDLAGGLGDDRLTLPSLAEGTHYVHLVAVSGAGLGSTAVGVAALRVDATVPEVSLSGLPAGWSPGPVPLLATAVDPLSGVAAAGAAGPFTAIAVDDGPPVLAPGAAVGTVVSGEGSHRVAYYARDAAGNVGDGQLGAPGPRTATVRIDQTPPQLTFTRAGDPADPELIEATVADPLSGAATSGGSIAVRRAGSGEPFLPLPTVAARDRLWARWDSDAFPPGNYEFRATASDRAGNRGSGSWRDSGERLILPSPLKERVELQLGFGGRQMVWHRCSAASGKRRCRHETIGSIAPRPPTRRMPYGRHVPVTGRLTDRGGRALSGLPVTLVETLASGTRRASTIRSGADGAFFARLPPGPSRWVEAHFAGDRRRSRAGARRLRLVVPAAVRMASSARTATVGGGAVRFRGRVGALAARVPRSGLQVELQFRLPGSAWTEFRTVRTDRRGRFRYAYAFSDDDSRGVRFLFRAHLPAQEGWPYAAGSSDPIAIAGR